MKTAKQNSGGHAFTLIELIVAIAMLSVLLTLFPSAQARTSPNVKALGCINNQKRLGSAWQQWSAENSDYLLSCQSTVPDFASRPLWVTGNLNYNGGDTNNYVPTANTSKSPLFPYLGKTEVFRCPADSSTVQVANGGVGYPVGSLAPRVRSYSVSQVFGRGEWLDGGYYPGQIAWRIYSKSPQVVNPASTFVFVDEHPGSINDGAFANTCTGNQPADPPSSSRIVDMPANWHNGAAGFSFADNHAEIHKWRSPYLSSLPTRSGYNPPLNIPATFELVWIDAHWLASVTTVRR